jgi:hypothetical protein
VISGYTWGYSSALTLVSTSGNSATFSKNSASGPDVSVSIIVDGTTIVSKSFFMGAIPDISDVSAHVGCEYIYHYGYIPAVPSLNLASQYGVDLFEWRGSGSATIEPHPSGENYVPGDRVRIIYTGGDGGYGGTEFRAHNACGWSDWKWAPAITSPCSTYSLTASPNPVNTTLNINITSNENVLQSKKAVTATAVYEIKLFNNAGSQVLQTTAQQAGDIVLNVSALPDGLYILYIHDGSDNPPQTQNIIVSH